MAYSDTYLGIEKMLNKIYIFQMLFIEIVR